MKKPARSAERSPDVLIANEGTLFLFSPLSHVAKEWIEEHVEADAQWFGSALVVEHRYALELAQALIDAGFAIA